MAIALKQGSDGNLARFLAADALEINSIEGRDVAANITIGLNLDPGQQIVLGDADVDVNVGRDLLLARDILPGAGVGSIGTGVAQYVDQAWVQAVNDNGPDLVAYNLNASGTNAGAYAIGVDPGLISNSTSTDLMTMLADLDTAISVGDPNQVTLSIEDGVTIAAGDCIAGSITAADRVTLANASTGAGQRKNFIGVCVSVTGGGVGNVGGTTTATFVTPSNLVTVAGATFTVGSALYMPEGGSTPNEPTATAPTDVGDLVRRIGFAISATDFIIEDLVGVEL